MMREEGLCNLKINNDLKGKSYNNNNNNNNNKHSKPKATKTAYTRKTNRALTSTRT
jgi:hypothetical protein